MISNATIQTPVTGREYTGDQRDALQALAQFYRALNARDIEMMQQNGPIQQSRKWTILWENQTRAGAKLDQLMKDCSAAGPSTTSSFTITTLHQSGDLFYVVGRERGDLDLSGQAMRLAIRTSASSKEMRMRNGGKCNHHGSIEYPQMLATYQEAVLGRVLVVGDPL